MIRKRNKKNKKDFAPNSGVIIGLTGGIGSGKSFILNYMKKLGFKTFDTDKCVHNLMLKGNEGYKKIASIYPTLAGKKSISRKKLAILIIKDKDVLKKIEKILHPLVRKTQQLFAQKYKKHSVVFEVPLLFENNRDDYYDYIIAAIVDPKTQKRRTLLRKGMTEAKFAAIVSMQVSNLVRTHRADFIIDTGLGKKATYKQIKDLIQNV